ncbi:MAG: aminopeptidase P family protein [Proteobacteria bacterium]|nr:aminopeptidase P family protein [Pseudomonadota bacterium]MBU1610385.1 aminopeptidase P family protein [Pseudomonadota bacterium]
MNKYTFENRREALRIELLRRNLDAIIVSHAANRYYLSGFELHDPQCNETAGWLVITADGRQRLMTDPRYEDAARRLLPAEDVFVYSGKRWDAIIGCLKGLDVKAFAFEPRAMSIFEHEKLHDQVTLIPAENVVEKLRIIKDADEIERMKASCALNHRLMAHLESQLKPGRTELEIAWEIERFFRENGASELAFDSIVGVGPNAALPHARPDTTTLRENELVLVDTGCRYQGYNSDQTRTFWVGENPSDRFKATKDLVVQAQQAAIDILRPGLTFVEAYRAALAVFEKAAAADRFTHGLGHGIGLETHEPPSLSAQADGVLQPGMVVTVEPGLYYPDWGGIRWEYMALITENGCEIM